MSRPTRLREVAFHEWIVLAYLAAFTALLLAAPSSAARTTSLAVFVGLLAGVVGLIAVVRGLGRPSTAVAYAYRAGLYAVLQLSFFQLRSALAAVRPDALDHALYAFDLAVFGFEPALWLEPLVTPRAVEWFAFCYQLHFVMLGCYVASLLLFERRQSLLTEFFIGLLLIWCGGNVVYTAIPGYGPYVAFAASFTHPLPDGFWLGLVNRTVEQWGAQKDIFPSLHTAIPLYLAVFAFRHRDLRVFRVAWVPTAFVAANIALATMVLRWHYLVDVVAGVVLGGAGTMLAVRLAPWECARRAEGGLTPPWPPADARNSALQPSGSSACNRSVAAK